MKVCIYCFCEKLGDFVDVYVILIFCHFIYFLTNSCQYIKIFGCRINQLESSSIKGCVFTMFGYGRKCVYDFLYFGKIQIILNVKQKKSV